MTAGRRLVFFLFVISIGHLFADQTSIKIGYPMPDFTIEDSNREIHKLENMRGKVILFIMGARGVWEDILSWASALNDHFNGNEDLVIFAVAPMHVPSFISREIVYKKAKEESWPVKVLLDWEQNLYKSLNAKEDITNIFVINREGIITHYQEGKYSDSNFELLKGKVNTSLYIVKTMTPHNPNQS